MQISIKDDSVNKVRRKLSENHTGVTQTQQRADV